MLQPPSLQEGFERVLVVDSFEASNNLLVRWGARPVEVQPVAAAEEEGQEEAGEAEEGY